MIGNALRVLVSIILIVIGMNIGFIIGAWMYTF